MMGNGKCATQRRQMITLGRMTEVRLSSADQDDVFSQRIREQWTDQLGRRLDILIAGCGRGGVLDVGRYEPRMTGVDEDLPPLRTHTANRDDLEASYLGDLRLVPIPPRSFDVVYVSFLLERIRHAELVLDRLVAGLRPGGLLLLKMRDRKSAYGFCDRVTPAGCAGRCGARSPRPGRWGRFPRSTSRWPPARASRRTA